MAGLVDDFAKILELKTDYTQLFALYGMNSEGWLQAELLRFLWDQQSIGKIRRFSPQRQGMGTAKRELHDIWIETAAQQVWCELKSFCTNYCGSPGKNITNRIDGLLEAMRRVRERSEKEGGLPLVLAHIYPFCDGEAEKRAWEEHWQKLSHGPLSHCREYKLPFRHSAQAYVRMIAWTSVEAEALLFAGPSSQQK